MSSFLSHLNPEQREAAEHVAGPLLILAGAGSGKTTVLVSRTGNLIQEKHAKGADLCVLTFTNKAARELKHRVSHKLGNAAKGLVAGTFHSFGLQILKEFRLEARLPAQFGILDSSDAQAIGRELMKGLNHSGKTAWRYDVLLSFVSKLREAEFSRSDASKAKINTEEESGLERDDEYIDAATWLLPKYIQRLDELGVVDFDGLLIKPLQLLESNESVREKLQNRFKFLMVDEFQDTNAIQMKLLDGLMNQNRNIGVVGDDDQSIYGWRGACIENILRFPNRYKGCKVVRLEKNYRSTHSILRLANAVIHKNEDRHAKVLVAAGNHASSETPELFIYEHDEAEIEGVLREIQTWHQQGIDYRDMAVIYRSNTQGALVEMELKKARVPYSITGGTAFLDHKEVKDVLAYLRCAFMPHEVAFRRAVTTPPRGVGDGSIENLIQWSNTNKKSIMQAVALCARKDEMGPAAAPSEIDVLGPRAIEGFGLFSRQIEKLRALLLSNTDWAVGLMRVLEEVGYRRYLETSNKDLVTAQKRWAFLEIFAQILDRNRRTKGASLETMMDFIQFLELRDNGDDNDEEKNEVQLLTLHASKGLEYRGVILIGVEEDLLPHKTLGTNVAEERRLFYVGLTRAKEKLILTRARSRRRYGRLQPVGPSRFLLEIPDDGLRTYDNGFRPVFGDARKSMLNDLLKKLEKPAEATK
jgi:superfamily I DNA/RNA helicase